MSQVFLQLPLLCMCELCDAKVTEIVSCDDGFHSRLPVHKYQSYLLLYHECSCLPCCVPSCQKSHYLLVIKCSQAIMYISHSCMSVVHRHLDMDSAELLTSKGGDDDLPFPVFLETAQSLRYQLGIQTL